MQAVDWPDDTLELMRSQLGPPAPFKLPLVDDQIRVPVTVPVLGPDVELYCPACNTWNLVADWEAVPTVDSIATCPECYALPASGHEHGEYERLAPSLFTVVLPVRPRHYETAFSEDPRQQARNAIAAARMARSAARRIGLELA